MNDGGMVGRLLSDSDAVLILALAYILYRENADKALVIALLSILIS
ncbi:MAG: hypothetical protein IK093_06730 [Ruminiclostridium sp.]|nr:hypothetical protein [Ruminiclostridium sp.]